jgi:hypothetical protein
MPMSVTVETAHDNMCYGCTSHIGKRYVFRSSNNMRGNVVSYCKNCLKEIILGITDLFSVEEN